MVTVQPPSSDTPRARGSKLRWFGHMQLLRLLGRSKRTMAWHVVDPSSGKDLMLVLPRLQLPDQPSLRHWQQMARQAARLDHPQLAVPHAVGVHEAWPYVSYAMAEDATLLERLDSKGLPGTQVAEWMAQLLSGLAFAHDAGLAHHDLQAHLVLISDDGQLRLAGLAVGAEVALRDAGSEGLDALDASALRLQRAAAQRDVLAAGVLMHSLLAGRPALDEPDTGQVIARTTPLGNELVRLPWSLPRPVVEPLRVIVNRATDRQERQRYASARSLLRALEGWLHSDEQKSGGPLSLLMQRLDANGLLPSMPGAAERVARLALLDGGRTHDLAEVVLEDPALAFEMLRSVNLARARTGLRGGGEPVLAVRRAIAMLGLEGVRRNALALRSWPGALREEHAQALHQLLQRCKRAARIALLLRPPGYDAEMVYLVTLLHNLGRLLLHYHFPEEAAQWRRLIQPQLAQQPAAAGAATAGLAAGQQSTAPVYEPALSEEEAAFAVLGTDLSLFSRALARQWGFDEASLTLLERPSERSNRAAEPSDDDVLRAVASCANSVVDALALPPTLVKAALARVVQRHGRNLGFSMAELKAALHNEGSASIGESSSAWASLAPVAN